MPRNTSERFKTAKQKAGKPKPTRVGAANQVVRKAITQANMSTLRMSLGEPKGFDTAINVGTGAAGTGVIDTTNTSGDAFCINTCQQGTGFFNRNGRKINLKSIRIRIAVWHRYQSDQTALQFNVEGNELRAVLVWDKQPTGVIPTFDTIFGRTDAQGNSATAFKDPVKYPVMERFSVLMDEVCETNINAGSNNVDYGGTLSTTPTTVSNFYNIDRFIMLKGRETVFGSTSNPATVADITTGALYIYYRAAWKRTGSNEVFITDDSVCRLRYSDL